MIKAARIRDPAASPSHLRAAGHLERATVTSADAIPGSRFLRHAVGVLETPDEIERTLQDLAGAGIQRSVISLTAAPERLGIMVDGAQGGWVELGVRSRSGARLASCGPLSERLLRLCAVEQAAIDALLARWLPGVNASFLAEQIDAGRVLLWVYLRSAEEEKRACGVLLANSRHRVEVHDLPALP